MKPKSVNTQSDSFQILVDDIHRSHNIINQDLVWKFCNNGLACFLTKLFKMINVTPTTIMLPGQALRSVRVMGPGDGLRGKSTYSEVKPSGEPEH